MSRFPLRPNSNFLRAAMVVALLIGGGVARAEIAGFEQLTEVTVDCPSTEIVSPEDTATFKVCSYKNIKCKLMDKGVFVFHGFVTIDCEKPPGNACPEISVCAKTKLRDVVADSVRQKNDPNNDSSHADGHSDPLESEKKAAKRVSQ